MGSVCKENGKEPKGQSRNGREAQRILSYTLRSIGLQGIHGMSASANLDSLAPVGARQTILGLGTIPELVAEQVAGFKEVRMWVTFIY